MRVLGLDYGTVRIGVALSDPTGTIAQALEVIPNRGFRYVLARVRALITAHEVDRILVGLPRRLDGREGAEAAAVRSFVAKLESALAVRVELGDERLSTAEAERAMIEADTSRLRRRGARDAVAAALVLQTYLEKEKVKGQRSEDGTADSLGR